MLRNKNSRDIILHTESQFYLPGDEINGTVTYHPKKQVNLRSVKIIFAGEEFCVWIDKVATRVGGPVGASKTALFKKETNLVGDRTRLDAGPHTWQFRFNVPRSIPPTCYYSGKASISYWLKAKAATSFGHFDARFRFPVTIGQFWIPQIPASIQSTYSTNPGNIDMTVKSSHLVVKCGEVVTLTVNLQNNSHRNLTGVRVKLKQIWECTGVFYHKNIIFKYFTKEGYPTSRGPHTTVMRLKIPNRLQTCPTVNNASLFKCTYYLAVYGVSKMAGSIGSSQNIKARVPITISNLPSTDTNAPANEDSDYESSSDSEHERDTANTRRTFQQTASESSLASARSSTARSRSNSIVDVLSLDSQGNYMARLASNGGALSSQNELAIEQLNVNDEHEHDENKKSVKFKSDNSSEDKKVESEDQSMKECIICYDGQKNMLLLPCAHIATCSNCTSCIMHSNKLCPVCRTKITQTMRIYPV